MLNLLFQIVGGFPPLVSKKALVLLHATVARRSSRLVLVKPGSGGLSPLVFEKAGASLDISVHALLLQGGLRRLAPLVVAKKTLAGLDRCVVVALFDAVGGRGQETLQLVAEEALAGFEFTILGILRSLADRRPLLRKHL